LAAMLCVYSLDAPSSGSKSEVGARAHSFYHSTRPHIASLLRYMHLHVFALEPYMYVRLAWGYA